MVWFSIVGTTLAFLGSVVFSAAVIKPKEQILDENESYWDGNPFTTSAGLASQPYYLVALVLLITGFSVSLGGQLGSISDSNGLLVPILFSISFSLMGYLLAALFFINRKVSHQKKLVGWRKQIFLSAARSYSNNMRGLIGTKQGMEAFHERKTGYQKDLLQKRRQIPDDEADSEQLLIQEIDKCISPEQFVESVEKYLDSNLNQR